jgi:hypothetical protein
MPNPAELDELFTTFKASAWRLEVRPSYGIPDEDQSFQAFLAGSPQDLTWFTPWTDLMNLQIRERGKRVERVRVIDQPPSDYLRWEYDLNHLNAEAGEDIRYLPRDLACSIHLPDYDFWIFDDVAVAFMVFAESGEFLGPVVVEDANVTRQHRTYQDTAWELATPFERYSL